MVNQSMVNMANQGMINRMYGPNSVNAAFQKVMSMRDMQTAKNMETNAQNFVESIDTKLSDVTQSPGGKAVSQQMSSASNDPLGATPTTPQENQIIR